MVSFFCSDSNTGAIGHGGIIHGNILFLVDGGLVKSLPGLNGCSPESPFAGNVAKS